MRVGCRRVARPTGIVAQELVLTALTSSARTIVLCIAAPGIGVHVLNRSGVAAELGTRDAVPAISAVQMPRNLVVVEGGAHVRLRNEVRRVLAHVGRRLGVDSE